MGKGPQCQSCGIPMSSSKVTYGTESDNSESDKYCSLCYLKGEFTYQTNDVSEYQAFVIDRMVENGWWRPIAWLLTRQIPKLSRWEVE
ncbi:MAG: hypothetical protein HOL17_11865 [Gammaproteobacteria bacterium]|jgi:hypothetical protein|nr:hypothetical protein [Gammaproteobacteria bacterium]MBT4608269.1 hypothetical protein [Thiotrichales bacterium]MBT4811024.1 hypothetical protein [Thiotrichales bacterium]MBT5372404.1 hypothetical protein [Gammaproteobacteria bacterium]MBT6653054.1 hypothetical protein [Gammaproteobacteria bacterium]